VTSEHDDTREEATEARRADGDLSAEDLDHPAWQSARRVRLARYWSGAEAPRGRRAEGRLLWTAGALCARFVCRQAEPYVVSDAPRLDSKTIGLWDRDVCELFVAPDDSRPEHYFEFEAAPSGEWLDLELLQLADRRETRWDYDSGLTVAARAEADSYTVVMRVPWSAFGRETPPRPGERWRANLYRCVGAGPERGYLAWRPTETPRPNFHVPEKFGALVFEE
jgi:Carbohydrate-binding family 9